MSKRFSLYNYTLLLLMGICFVGICFTISFGADSISDSVILPLNSVDSSQPISTVGYYLVQARSESTTPEAQPENSLDQSNSTDNSEAPPSATNNNGHSTESTDKDNLTPRTTTVECEGSALCVTGEVVKVINGKTFYVDIQNKVYRVELALIGLPVQSEEAMRAATTFTRNTCLGSNVLIDQDDGQKVNSFIAQVYCSPTKHLNSLLLQAGYVQLDKSQCETSEFSKLNWAKTYGC